jgi:hypothetical protein
MQNLNDLITTNFNDNISYIQKEQPKLFEKLSALDNAIENAHYQEKYELVYENGGFDVYEKSTKKFLYAKNSSTHAKTSVNSVNFKNDDFVFEGFVRHQNIKEKLQECKMQKPLEDYLCDILPIIDYTQTYGEVVKTLKKLDKFIFFGVGLGIHIDSIHKKIKSKVYLIVEDDLELFRLSLFTVNYKNIAKESILIFSVFDDKDEFINISTEFLNIKYQYNHYIKFFHLPSLKEDKLDQFQIATTSQAHIRFQFNNLMKQYLQPLNYLFSDYKFLNKTLKFDKSEFKDRAFLLLASGPSLQKNIKWLKKNHKFFITVAVSSSLAFLEKHNISPNIVLHIDPFEIGIKSFQRINNFEFIKDSIFFFSTSTPKNIVSLIQKEKLYFFETGTTYKNDSLKPSSPCVGSLAYQLLLILKAKYIYLLGLDLAVDIQTGKTHSGDHQDQKILTKDEKNKNELIYKESLFEIDGNFDKNVKTVGGFYSSILAIEYFTPLLQNDYHQVYNLSDGAKLSKAMPLRVDDIDLKNMKNISITKLESFIKKHSNDFLSDTELETFEYKLSHAKKMQQVLRNFNNKRFDCIEEYIEQLISHIILQDDINRYELSKVLDTYLKYILSHIYNFFNTSNLNDCEQHLDNLSKLLQKHILGIIEYYINNIEEKLNARD